MEKETNFKITGDKEKIIAYLTKKGFSNYGDCDSAGFSYVYVPAYPKSFWACSKTLKNSGRRITLSAFKKLEI